MQGSNQEYRTETHGERVGHSLPLCAKIVELLWKRQEKFHLQTLFVLGHNTVRSAEGNAYPIFNGFVVSFMSWTSFFSLHDLYFM